MYKIYKLTLKTFRYFVLITFISLNIYTVLYSSTTNYSSTDKSRTYKVFNTQQEQVGIIMGSMHLGLAQEDLEPSINFLSENMPQTKHVYIECKVDNPPGTAITGLESAFSSKLEKQYKEIEVIELENMDEQLELLRNIYQIGPYTYSLPFEKISSVNKHLAATITSINALLWLPVNLIYKNIINPHYLSEQQKEYSETMKESRRSFLENRTGKIDSYGIINWFRLNERDIKIFNKFKQHQEQEPGTFIMIIGQLHLANDNGILSIFEKEGYTLKPVDF